jgi:hypothetical protein
VQFVAISVVEIEQDAPVTSSLTPMLPELVRRLFSVTESCSSVRTRVTSSSSFGSGQEFDSRMDESMDLSGLNYQRHHYSQKSADAKSKRQEHQLENETSSSSSGGSSGSVRASNDSSTSIRLDYATGSLRVTDPSNLSLQSFSNLSLLSNGSIGSLNANVNGVEDDGGIALAADTAFRLNSSHLLLSESFRLEGSSSSSAILSFGSQDGNDSSAILCYGSHDGGGPAHLLDKIQEEEAM